MIHLGDRYVGPVIIAVVIFLSAASMRYAGRIFASLHRDADRSEKAISRNATLSIVGAGILPILVAALLISVPVKAPALAAPKVYFTQDGSVTMSYTGDWLVEVVEDGKRKTVLCDGRTTEIRPVDAAFRSLTISESVSTDTNPFVISEPAISRTCSIEVPHDFDSGRWVLQK